MAVVTAPLHSMGARGTLAYLLTYQGTKRGHMVTKVRRPRQPFTRSQGAIKLFNTFFTAEWAEQTTNNQDSWKPAAAADRLSNYHAWLKHNLGRAQQMKGGSQRWPILDADPLPTDITLLGVPQMGQNLVVIVHPPATPWYATFFRYRLPLRQASPPDAIAIGFPTSGTSFNVFDVNPPAGVNVYMAMLTMTDGNTILYPDTKQLTTM